jgi:hypothetical protein
MSFPKFPLKHEPWFECSICGLDFPMSEGIRHYKTKKLVDKLCADERTHADNMEFVERSETEHVNRTEQRVPDQGPAAKQADGGAGSGGAGAGGAGGDFLP